MEQQAQMLEQQKTEEKFNLALMQKLEKNHNEKQELKRYIEESIKERDQRVNPRSSCHQRRGRIKQGGQATHRGID